MVDIWEDELFVLKAVKADERLLLHDILEEEFGCVVSCDTARQNAPDSPSRAEKIPHSLSKYCVNIDAPAAAEWVSSAVSKEMADSIMFAQCRLEGHVQIGIFSPERFD